MQQTTKYKLNLIETSDTFSPDALNKNTEAIEAALTQHEATVSAALTRHEATVSAAITQHETTTSAALAKHKSETDSALAAHKTAVDKQVAAAETHITAVEQGANLVKLGYTVTTKASEAVTFDLSKIKMDDYAALLLFSTSATTSSLGRTYLSVNGTQMMSIMGYSSTSDGICFMPLLPLNGKVVGLSCMGGAGGSGGATGGEVTQSWAGVTQLSLATAAKAGALTALYGIKK